RTGTGRSARTPTRGAGEEDHRTVRPPRLPRTADRLPRAGDRGEPARPAHSAPAGRGSVLARELHDHRPDVADRGTRTQPASQVGTAATTQARPGPMRHIRPA